MTRTYEVPTISCDHCKHAIEGAVRTVDGVSKVEVSVADRTVAVDGSANDAAIRAVIEAEGYPVVGLITE